MLVSFQKVSLRLGEKEVLRDFLARVCQELGIPSWGRPFPPDPGGPPPGPLERLPLFLGGPAGPAGAGDVVSSPTFAIVNEYQGRLTVEHFDMYRVTGWDDLYSTGFFDYLDTDRVLVIEWSENIAEALPEGTVTIAIAPGEGETQRVITITGWKGEL